MRPSVGRRRLGLLALTALVPPACPLDVCVSDFFQHLLDGVKCKSFEQELPWLPPTNMRLKRLPSLADVNRTLLAAEVLWDPARRVCAGNSSLGLRQEDAPPGLCVHQSPTASGLFDQYAVELNLLSRWLQEAPICGRDGSLSAARPDALPDVVIVPSAEFHHLVASGIPGGAFRWRHCFDRTTYDRFWTAARERFHDPAVAAGRRPPTIVTAEVYMSDCKPVFSNFVALAAQPAPFLARVVVASSMSNQPEMVHALWPGIKVWRDGAEAELERRALLVVSAPDGKVKAEAFAGPLLVTVPKSVGLPRPVDWHRPSGDYTPPARRPVLVAFQAGLDHVGHWLLPNAQYIRPAISEALRASGAHCTPSGDQCVLCADPSGEECAAVLANDASPFSLAARSTFCVEPPGDTQGRSHAYVAIQSGCIPVFVNGGHLSYVETTPTWWPWLDPRGAARGAHHTTIPRPVKRRALAGARALLDPWAVDVDLGAPVGDALNYTRFAFSADSSLFRANGPSGAAKTGWVVGLRRFAEQQPGALAAMQAELRRVASRMLYFPTKQHCDEAAGPGACEEAVDGFAMLRRVVARAWQVAQAVED